MDDVRIPVAYSLRFYEKQLISANRFLGLPNAFWAAVTVAVITIGSCWYLDEPFLLFLKKQAVWLLAGWGALWGLFTCITPGRQRLKRIAQGTHRAEVTRIALAHGISMKDVKLANSAKERERLSQAMPLTDRIS